MAHSPADHTEAKSLGACSMVCCGQSGCNRGRRHVSEDQMRIRTARWSAPLASIWVICASNWTAVGHRKSTHSHVVRSTSRHLLLRLLARFSNESTFKYHRNEKHGRELLHGCSFPRFCSGSRRGSSNINPAPAVLRGEALFTR